MITHTFQDSRGYVTNVCVCVYDRERERRHGVCVCMIERERRHGVCVWVFASFTPWNICKNKLMIFLSHMFSFLLGACVQVGVINLWSLF